MGWSPLKRDSQRPSSSAASIRSKLLGGAAALKKNEDQVIEDTRVWQRDILPSWNSTARRGHRDLSKKAAEVWWRGIPPSLRERVWCLAIGNDLNITKELYEICLQRSKEKVWTQILPCPLPAPPVREVSKSKESLDSGSAMSSGFGSSSTDSKSDNGSADTASSSSSSSSDDSSTETVADLIKIDVSRTFPQLGLFQESGPYHEPLISVLGAYVTYRPDINYVQGMSFLAGMLLLNMDTESAFVAFANMLNNKALMVYYRLDVKEMRAYYETFQLLLRTNLPRVATHFAGENMTPDLYLVDWIYTLFSRSLPLDVASRVWDLYLRDGDAFIFRASLGLLSMYEDIVTKLDFIHLALFLTKLPDSIESDRLFEAIASIKMTADKKSFDDIVISFMSQPLPATFPGASGSNVSIASITSANRQ